MSREDNYLLATRHPWASVLFLLPLLIAYEVGVVSLGGSQPETLRGGVDAWLRWVLLTFGLKQLYVLPAVVAAVLLSWSWLRRSATWVFQIHSARCACSNSGIGSISAASPRSKI